jgi:hypothetical protein
VVDFNSIWGVARLPLINLYKLSMDYRYLFFLILLLTSSCQDKVLPTSKIKINLDDSKKGKFSEVFSDINYLLLDIGENEALIRPFHILFAENRIVVEDRDLSNIHFFDSLGVYLSSIKSDNSGGPQTIKQSEFLQISGNNLLVNDVSLAKTLSYDLNGNFIKESKESIVFDAFYQFNNHRILFTGLDGIPHGKIFIKQSLSNPSDTSLIYGFPKDYYWFGIGTKDGFMKDQRDEKVFFNIPYSYEIAQFSMNANLEEKIEFDFGRYGISHDDRFRFAESRKLDAHLSENTLIKDIHSFFPLKDHFFMYLYQQNPIKKPIHHFIVLDRDFKVLYQIFDPINDLDQMLIGGVPWTYHKDKVYFIVNSVNFYNTYVSIFSGKQVEIKSGNVHDFFQKNKEKLKNDKTVLVSLQLKNDLMTD